MSTALHITLAQINPIVGDLEFNANLIRRVRDAAPAHTDLIVFPEMAVCGYPPEDLVHKPIFLAQIAKNVRKLAKETEGKRARLIIPAPVASRGKIFNAAHVIGDGKILATVKKRHLPNYGVFDEQRHFARGPAPSPIEVAGHKIGLMICEDMWFSDVAAALKDKGAEMLVVVNASPYEITKHETRLKHARARVTETGLPLACVNQVGGQDELVFDGASFVLNEKGTLVMQADEFVEDIHHTVWSRTPSGHWLCADGEMKQVHSGPDVIYQAVMTGLRDYVTKNGFPGVIIGLSGGIDSALTAALAVDALGADAVHGVMMPSKYTAKESLDDAAALAKSLGIALDNISIESAVAAFEAQLKSHFTGHTPGIVHENIQPRCRGLILMALSNASGKMVLSTGNKSEVAVGYSTLYGDMCGGFSPLKDLYKMQVYELSRWRNANKPDHGLGPRGRVIPENSLTRAPTAELKPDQKDQDTLPPYEQLDAILECLLEKDMGPDEIAALGHDRKIVKRVWQMVDRAEYKRRQAAPGVKITSKAFGRDRRYPITHHFMASGGKG